MSLVVGETEVAVGAEAGVFGKIKPFLCHSRLRRLHRVWLTLPGRVRLSSDRGAILIDLITN